MSDRLLGTPCEPSTDRTTAEADDNVECSHFLPICELRCRTEVSNIHEDMWNGSAFGSASFNSQAAAVGIPAAVGRAETGLSCLSGLSGLSCWPDREQVYLVCLVCLVHVVERNKPDEPNQPDKQNKPEKPYRPDGPAFVGRKH